MFDWIFLRPQDLKSIQIFFCVKIYSSTLDCATQIRKRFTEQKTAYRGLLVHISISIYIVFENFENSQILLVYISLNLPPQAKIFRISHVEMLDFPYKINEKHTVV